ncbi:hypothetical protein [Acidovorax sp. NO-1]|nr:hypothetical protein [Acidovorax sp. NO-1]
MIALEPFTLSLSKRRARLRQAQPERFCNGMPIHSQHPTQGKTPQ